MFGLSSLKIIGGFTIVLLVVIGGFYWYYKDTSAKIALLHVQNAQLQSAIDTQTETINKLLRDIELQDKILNDTYKKFVNARKAVSDLEKKLKEEELSKKALTDPSGTEKAVNKEMTDMMRCFELISGDTPTKDELAVTSPDKANRVCPDLANPNLIGDVK